MIRVGLEKSIRSIKNPDAAVKAAFPETPTPKYRRFSLEKCSRGLSKEMLFEKTDARHPVRNQMTRERREIRRRLRHCNGLQTSNATDASREGGSEAKSGSQDTDLIVLVVAEESLKQFNGLSGQLLRQREG